MVKLLASIDTSLTKHIHELIQLYHLEREPRGSHRLVWKCANSNFVPCMRKLTPEFRNSSDLSECRARARGDPGHSFNGALKATQNFRCVAAGIRKRELRCANPAFRERTGRPARRPRRRSRRRARRAHVPHNANRVPRPGCGRRLWAHVRKERHPVAFRA